MNLNLLKKRIMQISFSKPESCCEIGKRENKEDYVYQKESLLMVCDGVGGSARGEVASQYSAETISNYFKTHFKGFQTKEKMVSLCQNAVVAAVEALQTHLEKHPESKGLATTLALLHFHEGGATIAHVGDSRVYHYRPNENLFVTEDHSLVMDLLKAGWIKPEDVRNHPRRNVITRAIQVGKTVQPTVQIITDIQKGDIFFLCSDGILESFTDPELSELFAQKIPNAQKMLNIQQKCAEYSNDNYSCILLQVSDVKGALQGESHFPLSTIEIEPNPPNILLEKELTWIPEKVVETTQLSKPKTAVVNAQQGNLDSVKTTIWNKESWLLVGLIALASVLIYAAFGKSETTKPPIRAKPTRTVAPVTPTTTMAPATHVPAIRQNPILLDTSKKNGDTLKSDRLSPPLNRKLLEGLPQ
jgi:PPM family protein phosphatase